MLSIVYAPFCFLGQALGHSGNIDGRTVFDRAQALGLVELAIGRAAHDGQRLGGARRHTMRAVRIEGAQVALDSAGVLALSLIHIWMCIRDRYTA